MHPIATTIELFGVGRSLGSYGIALAVALVVGGVLLVLRARAAGLDPGAVVASLGPALAAAFVGAWVLATLVALARGADPHTALARPGIAFYGGALAGVAVGAAVARRLGLPVGRALDAAVEPLLVGHAIGRVGCFLGGCCYGRPSSLPWAVRSDHPLSPMADGAAHHPVQLYATAALLVFALGFQRGWPLARSLARPAGQRFAAYVVAYACLRFGLEALRGDRDRGVFAFGLSTAQLISLALVAVAALAYRSRAFATPAARVTPRP